MEAITAAQPVYSTTENLEDSVLKDGPPSQLCDWVCSTKIEDLPEAVQEETATIEN